jgi:mono/diheme cytochrome c family protein
MTAMPTIPTSHVATARWVPPVLAVALASSLVMLATQSLADERPAGEVLYRRYCASCHGADGRGNGPVASALSPRPTDLTSLQMSEPDLMRAIDGRRTIRAHGTEQMPVWGEVFEKQLAEEPFKHRTSLLKVQTIAQYVRGLQRPAEK